MTSVSVMMTVMVLNVHHRGPNHKEIPQWVRWLVLDNLRPMLCMKSPHSKQSRLRRRSAVFDSPLISLKMNIRGRNGAKTQEFDRPNSSMDGFRVSSITGPWKYQNGSVQVIKFSSFRNGINLGSFIQKQKAKLFKYMIPNFSRFLSFLFSGL